MPLNLRLRREASFMWKSQRMASTRLDSASSQCCFVMAGSPSNAFHALCERKNSCWCRGPPTLCLEILLLLLSKPLTGRLGFLVASMLVHFSMDLYHLLFFAAFAIILAKPVPDTSHVPLLSDSVALGFSQANLVDSFKQDQTVSNLIQPDFVGFPQYQPGASLDQINPKDSADQGEPGSVQIYAALDASQQDQKSSADIDPESYPSDDALDTTDIVDEKKEKPRKDTSSSETPLIPPGRPKMCNIYLPDRYCCSGDGQPQDVKKEFRTLFPTFALAVFYMVPHCTPRKFSLRKFLVSILLRFTYRLWQTL